MALQDLPEVRLDDLHQRWRDLAETENAEWAASRAANAKASELEDFYDLGLGGVTKEQVDAAEDEHGRLFDRAWRNHIIRQSEFNAIRRMIKRVKKDNEGREA